MKKTNALANFIDDKYIPLEKKIKIAIMVALFLIPVALFYFLWLQPQYEETAKLIKQETAITKEVNKAKARAANKEKLQAEVAVIEKRFEETAVLLPKGKEIPRLLTNISALGRGSGLDFLTFKPGKDIKKDFYSALPINIKVRGPYHNMGVFLDQVSKLNRIVTVANITMGGPKKEGSELLLNSSCRLVTYRFTNKELPKPQDKNKKKKRR